MNEPSSVAARSASPERLALAQQAFTRFHTRCFWFMREDLRVGEEGLEAVIRGLRAHGNREAFLIAARLAGPLARCSSDPMGTESETP